ncbi:MAG: hypothetical protein AMXMBFR48_15550 [Ignavibacteriales bacterium]
MREVSPQVRKNWAVRSISQTVWYDFSKWVSGYNSLRGRTAVFYYKVVNFIILPEAL